MSSVPPPFDPNQPPAPPVPPAAPQYGQYAPQQPQQPQYNPQQYAPAYGAPMAKMNTTAIVGFILAFIFSAVGLVLGIVALVQIRKTGERGHGLALAATIIGGVYTLIFILAYTGSFIAAIASSTN